MKLTSSQFADMIGGLGSTYVSGGAYEGSQPTMLVGSFLKAVADEVRATPCDCEVPPDARSERSEA